MVRAKINRKKKKKKQMPAKEIVPEDKTLKITGLPDKCLKKICNFLEMDDLSNFAASCTRFNRVCGDTFETKFHNLYSNFQVRVFDLDDKKKLKSYTNMLTRFGKYMKKLRVEYDASNHRTNKQVHDLIVDCCSDSLIQLHIFEMEKCMKFGKPFKQLAELRFTRCHLNGSAIAFDKWCPNIRQLEFQMVQSVANTACIERTFPKLEEFAMLNFIDCNFTEKNVRNFIKHNPQLTRLRICRDIFGAALNITTDYISYIDQMLPNLELLEMVNMNRMVPAQVADNRWKFKNLKALLLTCQVANTVGPMKSITAIKRLDLDIQSGAKQQTLDYIMSCQTLQKLIWFLNKPEELKLLFKLSKTPLVKLTKLKLLSCFGLKDDIYRRCQVLVNVMDFMVHYKQIESIVVGFQMTNHSKCLFDALKGCELTAEFFDVIDESNDDECSEESIGSNSEKIFHFLRSFGKVIEHKFNGAWTMSYYLHKIPNKLMPVNDNLFICADFNKIFKQ